MASRKKPAPAWPFGRKFSLYLADRSLSLNHFANRHGFTQSSLQRWVKAGARLPAEALMRISRATKLPAEYWMDDLAAYPPPPRYGALAAELESVLRALPDSDQAAIVSIIRDADDRKQTLALRSAARRTP